MAMTENLALELAPVRASLIVADIGGGQQLVEG
jgi:hypothetical protein